MFAGSGPLALAFPAQLHHYGANVLLALEAGPRPGLRDVLRLGAAARGNSALLRDAVSYRSGLLRARVPMRYGRIVVRAEGDGRVERVVHAAVDRSWRVIPGTEEHVEADTLCVGYGFVPSVELLRLAGCDFRYDEDLGGPVVVVDEWQRTTAPGVSAAGDGAGIAGALVAVDEGRLAALGAALDLEALTAGEAERQAEPIRARLARKAAFRKALRRLHTIGDGVYELATDDTVVCRCEEVTRGELYAAAAETTDLNVVKSLTPRGNGSLPGEELSAPGRRDDRRPTWHSDRVRPTGDAALPGAAGADGRDRRLDDRGRRAVLLSDRVEPTAAGLDRRARRRRGPRLARRSRTSSPARASTSWSRNEAS